MNAHDRHAKTDGTNGLKINESGEIKPGDVVEDREDEDPDRAIVINVPGEPADEWDAYDDVTVAEDNPDYGADAEVVCVVFEEDLLDERPDYDGREIPLAYAEGFKFYSFPRPRLEVVGRYEQPEPELSDELASVEERLDGNADVARKEQDGVVVLVVEKLGEKYAVTPDGDVQGEGAILGRLEGVVEEVFEA